ncbi:phosphatidylethanolamine-binding protein [Pseudoneurospora amorphoporcata]|uniref:Phosphatidylethanolamine-binding protein n=1 Tax=Pseudoneurospora amorphoporcata TaxID=241081 RepID=A0AAN6NTV3_9PEZI|nr:phosphatidylethanolamine-binding protein [Pseudoneurospora amorphoporcata]
MKPAFGLVIPALLASLGHAASLVGLPDQHVLAGKLAVGPKPETSAATTEGVREALKKAEIIPTGGSIVVRKPGVISRTNGYLLSTVIDDFIPILNLEAKWSDDHQASLGNTLNPEDLQDTPSVLLKDPLSPTTCFLRSSTSLVIVITDPDAPSRDDPKWSEFCHWIAVGHLDTEEYPVTDEPTEPQRCPLSLSRQSLEDVVSYTPPAPPKKTGKHRYVILALAPVNGTSEKLHLSKPKQRKRWGYDKVVNGKTHGVRDWAAENGLAPLAANFIYAQNKKQ